MIPLLHETTQLLPLSPGETLAWSPRTGRGMRWAGQPDEARRGALGLSGVVDEDAWRPLCSAWPVVCDGALWAPDPWRPTAGGLPWRVVGDAPWQITLWRRLADAPTLGAALAGLDAASLPAARAWLRTLRAVDVQALQLWPPARVPHAARLPDAARTHLWSPPRPPATRTVPTLDDHGATALGDWHEAIADAPTHFDDVETTLAWTFGVPHAALGGRTWGRALRDALHARGLVPGGPDGDVRGRIVEVGAGSGEVARDFGVRPYLRVDRSPGLLAHQATVAPGTDGLHGDALALPLPDASVDLLVCNEVLADLPASPDAPDVRARHGLPPREGWTNTGALRFLEEIVRVLRPGGAAWVSEFGGDEPPVETEQLDHPEVSIHFGELAHAAERLGLTVERHPIAAFVGLDLSARWLWRPHWQAVRAIAAARGVHLVARACPDLPFAVEGLRLVPLTDEGPGPLPTRFECLLLRRPA